MMMVDNNTPSTTSKECNKGRTMSDNPDKSWKQLFKSSPIMTHFIYRNTKQTIRNFLIFLLLQLYDSQVVITVNTTNTTTETPLSNLSASFNHSSPLSLITSFETSLLDIASAYLLTFITYSQCKMLPATIQQRKQQQQQHLYCHHNSNNELMNYQCSHTSVCSGCINWLFLTCLHRLLVVVIICWVSNPNL